MQNKVETSLITEVHMASISEGQTSVELFTHQATENSYFKSALVPDLLKSTADGHSRSPTSEPVVMPEFQ